MFYASRNFLLKIQALYLRVKPRTEQALRLETPKRSDKPLFVHKEGQLSQRLFPSFCQSLCFVKGAHMADCLHTQYQPKGAVRMGQQLFSCLICRENFKWAFEKQRG